MEIKGGLDPKLVISQISWEGMSPEQQSKITYDTVISMRIDLIEISKKVDLLTNKPNSPCAAMDSRIEKLEKWKVVKAIATFLGSIGAGFGGGHINNT